MYEIAKQFRPFAHDVNTISGMKWAWLAIVMAFAFELASAAQVEVRVLDRDGHPADGLVVTLHGAASERRAAASAVMDQIDQRFVPFVLPVHVGTAVTFPNSDAVAHQVYSFSPAKRFELGLYRGRPHPPVIFDQPGIVVLGCNIHDKMIGYVFVTDAGEFGKTNEQGEWRSATLPAGEYRIEIWSPRFARGEKNLVQSLSLAENTIQRLQFRLTKALRIAPHGQSDPKIRDY